MKKNSEIIVHEFLSGIIKILIFILILAIYALIWHFICKTNNTNIIGWTFAISYFLGWQFLDLLGYRGGIWKFLLSIIGIPIFLGVTIIDAYNNHMKENKEIEKSTNKIKLKKNEYKYTPKSNIVQEKNEEENENNDLFDEPEYYCERCYKKISKEEYELNDWMCEDCYAELEMMDMEEHK